MKAKKFTEFLNEANNMRTLRGFLKELKKEYGPTPTEQSLADFIYNHYEEVTGEELEDSDPASNDHIADIISHFKMDGEDFMIAWEDRVNESKVEEGKVKVYLDKILRKMVDGGLGNAYNPKMRAELRDKIEQVVKDTMEKYDYVVESVEPVNEESEDGYRLRILADVGGDQATDWLAENPINFDKLKFALRNKTFTKYDLRDVIQGKASKSIEKKVMKEISESQVNEGIFRTYNEVVGYEFNNFKEAYLELHKDNEVVYDKKDDVSYGIRKGEKEPHWKYFHDDYTLHHSEKDRDVLGLIHGKKMVSKGHPWSK
jgi:hypothetical protein